jgi:hypothetical protein
VLWSRSQEAENRSQSGSAAAYVAAPFYLLNKIMMFEEVFVNFYNFNPFT